MSSSRMTSRLALPAVQAMGSDEWEWPNESPPAMARSSISSEVTIALTARPPPKCFDTVMMSGTTPSCW